MIDAERFQRAALILAAHGSHLNPHSGAACCAAADAVRKRRLFAEVQECFWKQEPSFRHVRQMVNAPELFVVPFFISDGYFTETVLPRELGVTPPVSRLDGKLVHYCQPVGTHDSMTRVILHRAETIVRKNCDRPPPTRGVALFIAGHGTDRNENSAQSILRQVERIRRLETFRDVHAVFLDQDPRIECCFGMTRSKNLVIVPFFISDGKHTQEDIPRRLGLSVGPDGSIRTPSQVGGRRVWYSATVGTDAQMADVVVERAAEAIGS